MRNTDCTFGFISQKRIHEEKSHYYIIFMEVAFAWAPVLGQTAITAAFIWRFNFNPLLLLLTTGTDSS